MKPPLKAALFDLDGTLLNTLKDLANATNRALASAGYPVHPVEAYRHFVGNGLRTLVIRALPAGEDTSPALDELVKRTGENYARVGPKRPAPIRTSRNCSTSCAFRKASRSSWSATIWAWSSTTPPTSSASSAASSRKARPTKSSPQKTSWPSSGCNMGLMNPHAFLSDCKGEPPCLI